MTRLKALEYLGRFAEAHATIAEANIQGRGAKAAERDAEKMLGVLFEALTGLRLTKAQADAVLLRVHNAEPSAA